MVVHERLSEEGKKWEKNVSNMQEISRREASRTAEHFRGTIRTSISGFADMMRSQAAWIAGYGVMFGTLGMFSKALKTQINMQHEFARAMRTARSDIMSNSEAYKTYLNVGTQAMIRFGQESKVVGEVLYQLGSANLNVSETLAAMVPALNLVIGAEGDVQESTKLMASVFNNFKKSAELKDLGSLDAQMKYISDTIIRTFDVHQVELKELTEGYKYLLAMGKETNLSFTEMSGILGFLNDRLIKSSVAGTSVQTILARISEIPTTFAKAFDIEIDPSAPIDLLGILDQINKKLSSGKLSALEVGLIFERLGMRGAKAFTLLAREADELRKVIWNLEKESVDAGDKMAKIMLEKPDVAFQQLKQSVEALIRTGISPLVTGMQYTAVGVSKFAEATVEMDDGTRAVLGTMVQLIATFVEAALVIKGVIWISNKLAKGTADYQTISEILTGKNGIASKYNKAYESAVKFSAGVNSLDNVAITKLTKLKGVMAGLLALIPGGVATLALFGTVAAAIVGYKLYDWIHKTNEELATGINKANLNIQQSHKEASVIQTKINKYKDIIKLVREQGQLTDKQLRDYPQVIKYHDLEGRAIQKKIDEIEKEVFLEERKKELKISDFAASIPENMKTTIDNFSKLQSRIEKGFPALSPEFWKKMELPGERLRTDSSQKISSQLSKEVTETLERIPIAYQTTQDTLNQMREVVKDLAGDSKDKMEGYIKSYEQLTETIWKFYVEYVEKMRALGHDVKTLPRIEREQQTEEDKRTLLTRRVEQSQGMWSTYHAEQSELANLSRAKILQKEKERLEESLSKYASSYKAMPLSVTQIKDMAAKWIKENPNETSFKGAGELSEQYEKVKRLGQVTIELEKANRENDRTVTHLTKTYRDMFVRIDQGINSILAETADLGLLDKMIGLDANTNTKIQGFFNEIDSYIDQVEKSTPYDVIGMHLAKIGKSKEQYKKDLYTERDRYKEMADLQKEIYRDQSMNKYYKDLRDAEDAHKNRISELIYQLNEYHSVEQQMLETRREQNVEIKNMNNKITDYSDAMKIIKKFYPKMNEDEKKYLDLAIKALEEKIGHINSEIDLRKKLNDELNRRLYIERQIEDLRKKASAYEPGIEASYGLGNYSGGLAREFSRFDYEARANRMSIQQQWDKSDMFQDPVERAKELEMIDRETVQKRLDIWLNYHNTIYQREAEALARQAELQWRFGESWQSVLSSMEAATMTWYAEHENISRNITKLFTDVFYKTSDVINELLWNMVDSSENTTEAIKEIMYNFLKDLSREFLDFAADMAKTEILKFVFQTLGGMALSSGSGSQSQGSYDMNSMQGSMGYYGNAQSTGVTGTQYYRLAEGGSIKGGIPGKDSVHILGMPGEYILPTDSVDHYGLRFMEALRNKEVVKMQEGGFLGIESRSRRVEYYNSRGNVNNENGYGEKKPVEQKNINYITIQTNDVNSFREALQQNKDMISGLVYEDFQTKNVIRRH